MRNVTDMLNRDLSASLYIYAAAGRMLNWFIANEKEKDSHRFPLLRVQHINIKNNYPVKFQPTKDSWPL